MLYFWMRNGGKGFVSGLIREWRKNSDWCGEVLDDENLPWKERENGACFA